MHRISRWIFAAVMVALFAGLSPARAEKSELMPPAPKASSELERIKTLSGRWKGHASSPGKESDADVEYRVTAGGSAVVETLFAGTDHEMVSVYYDRDGKLGMTHYCILGNQPGMALKQASEKSIELDFVPGAVSENETHMHGIALAWDGPDRLTQTWTLFTNGQKESETVIALERQP